MCDEMSTGDADRIEDNDLLPYCAQEADGLPATEKEKRLAHWLKEIQQLPPPQRQLLLKNFSVDELIAFHKNNKEWDKVTKQIAREFNWEEFSLAEIDDDPHHKKALGLALLAKVAYSCIDTSRSVQSCFPAWCDALIDSDFKIKSFGFQNGCSRGVIFTRGRDVVLAFRGSSKLQDLASDLDACYAPGYGGQVHKGMKRVFDDGRENLMAALDGIRREDGEPLRVALTGHSMGGVFAYFAACELANSERFDIKKIVSFGAPKVFDEQAAASYKASGLHDKTTRYEHFSDLVPFLPPVPKKIYQSIGKQYYLSKNNAIFIDPEKFQVQADQARRFGIREQIAFGFERRTILDHALDSYVKSLYIYHS